MLPLSICPTIKSVTLSNQKLMLLLRCERMECYFSLYMRMFTRISMCIHMKMMDNCATGCAGGMVSCHYLRAHVYDGVAAVELPCLTLWGVQLPVSMPSVSGFLMGIALAICFMKVQANQHSLCMEPSHICHVCADSLLILTHADTDAASQIS